MKGKFWPLAITLLAALILSACTIDITTIVNPDGSGSLGMTYKLTVDDIKNLEGMGMIGDTICEQMSEGEEEFIFVREEHGDEIWCIASRPIATLETMKTEMDGEGFTVNTLEIMGNQFTFDANADMSQQEGAEGFDLAMLQISYSMTAPGKVTNHNGDSITGNTVTWKLPLGESKNLHLESKVGNTRGGLDLGGTNGNNTGAIIALVLTCCCCLIVIVIIVIVVVVLMRRKQNTTATM